jgi:hypothetical protein
LKYGQFWGDDNLGGFIYIPFSLREKVAESRMRVLSMTQRLNLLDNFLYIGENPHLSRARDILSRREKMH